MASPAFRTSGKTLHFFFQFVNNSSTRSSLSHFEKFQRHPCHKLAKPSPVLSLQQGIFFVKGKSLLNWMTGRWNSSIGAVQPPTWKLRSPQNREIIVLLELCTYLLPEEWVYTAQCQANWLGSENGQEMPGWAHMDVPNYSITLNGFIMCFLQYHVAKSCLMQISWNVWCNYINTFL